jgi:ISXO2 transposase-like protein
MDDAYLGGERCGGKRGRGAPGKTPIIVAMETTPEGQPVRLQLRRVSGFRRKEVEKLARRSLDPTSTVVSDGLACFRGVTDAGCTHQPIRTGSGRKAVLTPAFKWVNTALGNIKTAITATYRAIRQKHIPATWPNSRTASIGATISPPCSPASVGPPFEPRRCPTASSNWLRPMRNQVWN